MALYFNPRTPCGVRLAQLSRPDKVNRFQSTHPVWGATCAYKPDWFDALWISIHAPRVGCDQAVESSASFSAYFNPRTPCGVRLLNLHSVSLKTLNFNPRTPCGVRPDDLYDCNYMMFQFQSTHPVWGATG